MEGDCWLWWQLILTELHFSLIRDLVGLKADLPSTSIAFCLEEHNDAVIPVIMVPSCGIARVFHENMCVEWV